MYRKKNALILTQYFAAFPILLPLTLLIRKSILSRSDEYGFGIKREHVKLLKWKLIERCQNLK